MKQSKTRRQRYFLSQTSQPRMLLGMLLMLGLVALTMTIFVFLSFNLSMSDSFTEAQLVIQNVQQIVFPTLAIVNLSGAILSVVLVILYTHRIAGPIYGLGSILRGMAEGDLSESIRFRKGDFLHEIADDGNSALDFLRQEIKATEQLAGKLATSLEQSRESGAQLERLEEMANVARELHDRLSKFHLEKED